MFFVSKIRAAAATAGVDVEFIKSLDDFERQLEVSPPPALVIIDLNTGRVDPIEFVNPAKARTIPVVGFVSHVQVDLMRRAQEAGVDHVMPRSAFSQKLPQILSGNIDTTAS
jgi:DNA-binding NarL/FixJ family response regulator